MAFKPQKRVRWLALSVLARSLKPTLLSSLFTKFSDRREVEAVVPQGTLDFTGQCERHGAMTCRTDCPTGCRKERSDLWIDYVSDTGDGFNASASVASLLVPETSRLVNSESDLAHETRAGSLLVLGGDQVYPFASKDAYKNRFIGPFRAVFPRAPTKGERTMVALPGNHDWYDGLTAFLQVFCGMQWIGGWKTVQRRSYFACKLPNRWWLWGIDIQLDTYIDHPQLDYFRLAGEQIRDGDGLILCWAAPSWLKIDEDKNGDKLASESYRTLEYFQREIVPSGTHLRLSLTGDSHHYARYEAENGGEQKITAGLGGAFLSATHDLPPYLVLPSADDEASPIRYQQKCIYPSEGVSRSRRKYVLKDIYTNYLFAALPALVYAAIASAITSGNRFAAPNLSSLSVVASWVGGPWPVATGLMVIGMCVAFSKPQNVRDWWRGFAHGLVHFTAAAGITYIAVRVVGGSGSSHRGTIVATAALFGALVGPLVFALNLLVSDLLGHFNRNMNELFAAQAVEDYKGFVRIHVKSDGDLEVFPIKVEKVATRWTTVTDRTAPTKDQVRVVPEKELEPELIEGPFTVTRVPGKMAHELR